MSNTAASKVTLDQIRETEKTAGELWAALEKKRGHLLKAGIDVFDPANRAQADDLLDLQASFDSASRHADVLKRQYGAQNGFELGSAEAFKAAGFGAVAPGMRAPLEPANFAFSEFCRTSPEAIAQPSGSATVGNLVNLALSRPHGGFRAALDGGSLGVATMAPSVWSDLPRRALSVLDLVPVVGEVQDLGGAKLQYFKTTVRTNNAAVTAALAEKPSSVLTVKREETEMFTYAHISEQVPQQYLLAADGLGRYLELDMAASVTEAFEADCLSGNGSSKPDGITNVSGTLTQASSGDQVADVRKGITQLQTANVVADAVVVNPSDLETLDLSSDADGQYYLGGPLGDDTPRLWRLPVIASTGLSSGTAIVGGFRTGAVRWNGISRIEWGRINTDFQYNALRLVAEAGLGFAVCRPGNFCLVTI